MRITGRWSTADWLKFMSHGAASTPPPRITLGVLVNGESGEVISTAGLNDTICDWAELRWSNRLDDLVECDLNLELWPGESLIEEGLRALVAAAASLPATEIFTFDDLIDQNLAAPAAWLRPTYSWQAAQWCDLWLDAFVWRPMGTARRPDLAAVARLRPNAVERVALPVRTVRRPMVATNNDPVAVLGSPSVDVVIPSRFSTQLLEVVISGLHQTSWSRMVVTVVDNSGYASDKQAWYDAALDGLEHRVLWWDDQIPFNFSAVNNHAVAQGTADIVVLLNDDIELSNPTWLQQLVSVLDSPGVGVVGAQLLDGDGTIQHGGLIVGLNGLAEHLFVGLPPGSATLLGPTDAIREVSAVTAAVLVIRRSTWELLGGFDERFELTGNDVDLCIRAAELGLRSIVVPNVGIVHHESSTRGPDAIRADAYNLWWASRPLIVGGDPCFHPGLSYQRHQPTLLDPTCLAPLQICSHHFHNPHLTVQGSRPVAVATRAEDGSFTRCDHHHASDPDLATHHCFFVPDTTDLDAPEVAHWLALADQQALVTPGKVTIVVLEAPSIMWATSIVKMSAPHVRSVIACGLGHAAACRGMANYGPPWALALIAEST